MNGTLLYQTFFILYTYHNWDISYKPSKTLICFVPVVSKVSQHVVCLTPVKWGLNWKNLARCRKKRLHQLKLAEAPKYQLLLQKAWGNSSENSWKENLMKEYVCHWTALFWFHHLSCNEFKSLGIIYDLFKAKYRKLNFMSFSSTLPPSNLTVWPFQGGAVCQMRLLWLLTRWPPAKCRLNVLMRLKSPPTRYENWTPLPLSSFDSGPMIKVEVNPHYTSTNAFK